MVKKDKPDLKCPECGASVWRPKCMFELGGDCPRHSVRMDYEKKQRDVSQKEVRI